MTKLADKPLLSVIVPVYGTEDTLTRCFDSILNCTYPNIELIAVNDCSPGNASEIISNYAEADNRVHLVEHEKNKGLFLARMTGVANSHGKYIAFLDSDDHVSVDFYRRLIVKAEETDSDMVMGEFVIEYPDHFAYFNLCHTHLQNIDVRGEEVRQLLFSQEGKDFSLHVVWNKLYRRDLWQKSLPYLQLQTQHLIMCEDVLFSSVLFYFAQHATNIHGDFVYYVQNTTGSTALNGSSQKYIKNIKDIKDIKHVFNILQTIFEDKIKDESILPSLQSWRRYLMRVWQRYIDQGNLFLWKRKKLEKLIQVDKSEVKKHSNEDNFYYTVSTEQHKILNEELKQKITVPSIKVISFDIFDTLIQRPFWQPTDIFYLLCEYVNQVLDTTDYIDFTPLRIEAEARARRVEKEKHPGWEDITLDDIYRELQRYLNIDDKMRDNIKQKEIELEIKYCKPRIYAKEIFDMVQAIGKRIVITSDMYLPKQVVEQILHNAGYKGYEQLFLSSEEKVTKATGNLYDAVAKNLQISSNQILHIGDNLHSDIKMAEKKGWNAFHFPKAIDRFMNVIPELYGGNSYQELFAKPFALRDGYQYNRYWGWRTLAAVAANKMFENPYVEFHPDTDFNADPCVIGYYALGMHLFAVDQWLAEEVEKHQYTNVNFMARDGYLPMQGYMLVKEFYKARPAIHYLHLTRSVMLPLQMQKAVDFYGLVHDVNIFSQTPKKILSMLEPVLNQSFIDSGAAFCQHHGFVYDALFKSETEFLSFIQVLSKEAVDKKKSKDYIEKVGKYLADSFIGKTATFDVGYSCRVESLLKKTYGFDVSPYYMHINNNQAMIRSKKNQIDIHRFYEYSPGVTGVLRELFISKQEPSCKSLELKDGKIVPVFKEYHPSYIETYVIKLMQDNALQFVQDVVGLFGEDIKALSYQRADVSLPIEYYQSAAKFTDRRPFAYGDFEDDLGLGKSISTFDYWNGQIENVRAGIGGGMDLSLKWMPSKWQRAICLYFIDRNYLKYKVKNKLSNHTTSLSLLIGSYKSIRKVYRLLKKR